MLHDNDFLRHISAYLKICLQIQIISFVLCSCPYILHHFLLSHCKLVFHNNFNMLCNHPTSVMIVRNYFVLWDHICMWLWSGLNMCSLSSRSTISSGPSQRSRYTERSGTTWLFPSPRQSATSRTTSPSTPGSSRCQSSLFTYSVSSRLDYPLSCVQCAACTRWRWCYCLQCWVSMPVSGGLCCWWKCLVYLKSGFVEWLVIKLYVRPVLKQN